MPRKYPFRPTVHWELSTFSQMTGKRRGEFKQRLSLRRGAWSWKLGDIGVTAI